MTKTALKRGSNIVNLIPLKATGSDRVLPVGSLGTVYRKSRSGSLRVGFKDSYFTFELSPEAVSPANLNNQQVPKVGDIFYSSWGYDQTNIDFYQVVAMKKSMVTLHRIDGKQTRDPSQHLCGQVVAIKDSFRGEPKSHRVYYNTDGTPSVKLNSYSGASTWDGKPMFFSEWH